MSFVRPTPLAVALCAGGLLVAASSAQAQRGGRGASSGGGVRPAPVVQPARVNVTPSFVRPAVVATEPRRVVVGAGVARNDWWWNSRYRYWWYPPAGSGYGAAATYIENNYYVAPPQGVPSFGGVAGQELPPLADTPAAEPAPAEVEVILPDAKALVWFNGKRMSATGEVRTFATPPLEPGRDFSYDVTAAWHEGARLVTDRRTVAVSAGGTTLLDFTRPAPKPPSPRPPAP